MLVAVLHAGNIDLLPLNGDVVGLEDLLDRLGDFGTNTITYTTCSGPARALRWVDMFWAYLAGVPGMRVTVYLPPNLVGLKMSWPTVAIAGGRVFQYLIPTSVCVFD